jgi:hypothetical protein
MSCVLLIVSCLTSIASAQTPPQAGQFQVIPVGPQWTDRAKRLVEDAKKITVTILMDRTTYFPGERYSVTLRVTNPTSSVLEIPDPFDIRGASTDLWSRSDRWKTFLGSEWIPESHHPNAQYRPMHVDPPSISIPAGHTIERTFESNDKLLGDVEPLIPRGKVPFGPGDYRLVFNYPKPAQREFQVVAPLLEAIAKVPLDGVVTVVHVSPSGTTLTGRFARSEWKRRTFIAALGGDGAHWIVAAGTEAGVDFPAKPGAVLTLHQVARFSWLVRVARSNNPIVSISGVADAAENITITWTDSTGRTGSARVDRNRNVLPPAR